MYLVLYLIFKIILVIKIIQYYKNVIYISSNITVKKEMRFIFYTNTYFTFSKNLIGIILLLTLSVDRAFLIGIVLPSITSKKSYCTIEGANSLLP